MAHEADPDLARAAEIQSPAVRVAVIADEEVYAWHVLKVERDARQVFAKVTDPNTPAFTQ